MTLAIYFVQFQIITIKPIFPWTISINYYFECNFNSQNFFFRLMPGLLGSPHKPRRHFEISR